MFESQRFPWNPCSSKNEKGMMKEFSIWKFWHFSSLSQFHFYREPTIKNINFPSVTFLLLPICHYQIVTFVSLPNCHYKIDVTKLSPYQIVITKLSLPNCHCQIDITKNPPIRRIGVVRTKNRCGPDEE